jgi:O-succinylbenzoate synthase
MLLIDLKKNRPILFSSNLNTILTNELYRPNLGPSHYSHSKCIKIKISPTSVLKTKRLLIELNRCNPQLKFRLDGNRLFEFMDMQVFLKDLSDNLDQKIVSQIDYIEEPFKIFSELLMMEKISPFKFALDESFISFYSPTNAPFLMLNPIVIKPSLYGISSVYNWMRNNPQNRVIISSSFEHPSIMVGLSFLAKERPTEFHGLENFFEF